MPNDNGNNEEELFGKVSQTSADDIFAHIFKQHDYNDDDLEKRDREDDYELRRTLKDLKSKAVCFAAKILAFVIIAIISIVCVVVGRYLWLVFDDQEKIFAIISGILSYLFGVASTLCIEFALSKKDSNNKKD